MQNKASEPVLIPILSKQENNPSFLLDATQDAKRVILLVVIDKDELLGPVGFTANDLKNANELMAQISNFLSVQGKGVETVLEWGATVSKTVHLAELHHCHQIVLVKQKNDYYKKLAKQMASQTKIKIREIALAQGES